jgi:glycosyltransferase involved in cell wall biosynthesis
VPENMGKLPILFKQPGNLKLVSVALVGPMKNYHLVLAALKKAEGNVTYNIYGPVVNRNYWNDCLNIIKDLPNNIQVNYHGELPPEKVKDILAENHVFILPSVSENFGHAIFESLSAAKPVITSNNTPWKNLQNFNAGWNTETTTNDIAVVINEAIALNNDQYSNMCNGAKAVADEYLNKADFSTAYKQLFG